MEEEKRKEEWGRREGEGMKEKGKKGKRGGEREKEGKRAHSRDRSRRLWHHSGGEADTENLRVTHTPT